MNTTVLPGRVTKPTTDRRPLTAALAIGFLGLVTLAGCVSEQHAGGALGATLIAACVGLSSILGIGLVVTSVIRARSALVTLVAIPGVLALLAIACVCAIALTITTGAYVVHLG